MGLIWWLMGPEVLYIHGTISHEYHLCRDAEEVKKEEQAELRKAMTKGRMSGRMNHTSSSARILILMLYRCLLPLRTDLELALLRPLNKLQQPLELFFRHLNKRKEDGWKKIFFKKKVIEKGVGKGTLFNTQRPLSSAK